MRKNTILNWLVAPLLFVFLLCSCETKIRDCEPTPFDEIGPFYRPNAPVRNKIGNGHSLTGSVLSVKNCSPLPFTKLEFWQVNSEGEYDDEHRATVIADGQGKYSFESNLPTDYLGRLPHIHVRITSKNHEELITQYYPKEGVNQAEWDIVLTPLTDR
nr:intradiol ring-cleavage dioxygenase [Desulfobulbaceae bacterium]